MKIKEAELKHLAQIQSTADVNATETADKEKSADAATIKADIEAQFAAKIKVVYFKEGILLPCYVLFFCYSLSP